MAADINMYGLKYQFSRTSTNGADILITIHKKWYEGEVITRALGRAPVIKRENKDHIYGTSCELYLECKVDGEFAEMYTSDPMEYRVAVYKDEALLFIGFVSPELYSEPDIAPPYDVQIIATDGLGELKNFDFGKRGTASILSHINYLMSKSGIGVPINVVSDLRFANSSGVEVAAKEILSIKVNLDHEANNSCYEALQSLLASLNANITQLNGRYLIFRETDFIAMASDSGVEAFDVNGGSLVLPVAKFGSMQTCQWWPVGQLSTVIEPAKNHISLKSSDHYKSNVLDFEDWSLIGASYDEKEAAYLLPNKNSAITQTITFGDQEVGYRLGLRVRARNVASGSSDKEQNLGLKVEMEGRAKAFSIDLGPNFWLIKSEGGNAGTPLGYIWRSSGESSIEEELRVPSAADSAADAQTIDIVLPFIEEGSNNYDTYTYAKAIKINIFNPLGEHGIYVYDVSLVKYEQIKGYQADVLINNSAREAGADIEFTLSSGIYAPAAADIFMTGLPLQPSGHDIITQWKTGDDQMREYLAAMSFDYSRAVALPKMKYTGVLNVPGSEPLLPTLFLRDGTFYFPKTYTYDLYADELNVELISISAADVSLSSVVISQTSEASATMGATTGSVGGGGIVSMPRDKEMSDTSDNAVENRVIKAYIDNLWHLDENGNLVTDKQVIIKNNLIIDGDTSSGGEGEDTPSGGISGVKVNGVTYYDDNGDGVIDLGTISGGGGTADLSNYYTKAESDNRYLASSLLGSNTLIHSGNIGSQSVAGIRIGEQIRTQEALDAFNDAQNLRFVGVGSVLPSPIVASDGIVISIPWYNTTFGAQIAIDDQSNVMLLRTRNQGVWNPWYQFITAKDDGYVYGLGGMIDIQYTDEINRYGGNLYLQHRGMVAGEGTGGNYTGHVIMCANGGNVLIGTATDDASHKVQIDGTLKVYEPSQRRLYTRINSAGVQLGVDTSLYTGGWNGGVTVGANNSSIGYVAGAYLEGGTLFKLFYGGTFYENASIVINGLGGNVGIKNATPQYELDVNGGIKATKPIFGYMYGTNNNAAAFIFDKPGLNYTGIGSDGVSDTIRFGACDINGTWVSYNQKWKFYGDIIVTGDTSSGSDIRFKDVIKNKTLKIEHIAKAPLFTFKWNDREDDTIHLGSSAQYWENIAPWLVSGDDFKSLNYATLGVAMGISLAKKAVNHEERIKVLEKEIKRLKEEMIHG